jgi:hypothetical protein
MKQETTREMYNAAREYEISRNTIRHEETFVAGAEWAYKKILTEEILTEVFSWLSENFWSYDDDNNENAYCKLHSNFESQDEMLIEFKKYFNIQ